MAERSQQSGGISRRQLFEDIRFMESADGWNIELLRLREGRKIFYRYKDPAYSINNMPLNEAEINELRSAIELIGRFEGMPQFEWIELLMTKLQIGKNTSAKSESVVGFDHNAYLKGIEHIRPLYHAITYHKVLEIKYRPFEEAQAFKLHFHPYYLRQYNNRWFIFGFNPDVEKSDWNLALDRIETIYETSLNFQTNSSINWSEYFEDIIGVTKPAGVPIEKIKLHFFGKSGHYMVAKPIHGSQKSKWLNDSTLELTLELIINYELERLILSYCDTINVIEPPALKQRIADRISHAFELKNIHPAN
ncbi:helix-turn-helix transcriptional regulator [Mucilaginibacter sp.]